MEATLGQCVTISSISVHELSFMLKIPFLLILLQKRSSQNKYKDVRCTKTSLLHTLENFGGGVMMTCMFKCKLSPYRNPNFS